MCYLCKESFGSKIRLKTVRRKSSSCAGRCCGIYISPFWFCFPFTISIWLLMTYNICTTKSTPGNKLIIRFPYDMPRFSCHDMPRFSCHDMPRFSCHDMPRFSCHAWFSYKATISMGWLTICIVRMKGARERLINNAIITMLVPLHSVGRKRQRCEMYKPLSDMIGFINKYWATVVWLF